MPQLMSILVVAASLLLQSPDAARSASNQLTAAEQAAGWQLLFDGKTLDGWRAYRRETAPEAGWEVKEGTIRTVAKVKGAELVTRRTFNDFELAWEWRGAPRSRSTSRRCCRPVRPAIPRRARNR